MDSKEKDRIKGKADWICQFVMNISGFVAIEAAWEGDELVVREGEDNESSSPQDDVSETSCVIAEITKAKVVSGPEKVNGRHQCRLSFQQAGDKE